MKQTNLLARMLLLFALIVGSTSVWAADITATLSGSSMIIGTNPSTSYTAYTSTGATDNDGNIYYGRWCYQKYNNNYLNMFQLKKCESSNSSRIQLPQFSGVIKSITLTATNSSSNTSSGTGAKTRIAIVNGTDYSSTFITNSDNQVLIAGSSSTTTTSYVFDFTTLEDTYDGSDLFLCSLDAAIRIWSIEVVYTEANYYNITYKYNDGVTANKTVQVDKDNASSYTLEAAPSRTNFTFAGWNDGTDTYDAGVSYAITSNTTFTAQWTFSGETTDYNRSTKPDMATGAKYIMAGVKSNVWGFATDLGTNTYLGAGEFDENSTISASVAKLTSESPLEITLEETTDGWYLKDANGKKLGMTGDKKVGWDDGDMTWVLGGTDEVPTFTATNGSSDYTMYYNAGSTRFNAYTSKGSNVDAYFYRLADGKNVYTLLLDFNDGATADEEHRVLEGAEYTLVAPTRTGYAFAGWNTEEDGTGTSYAAGAYTMPADDAILYAQWVSNVTVSVTDASGYATYTPSFDLVVPEETKISAYKASLSGDDITFTKVATLKAGEGYLLAADGAQTETFTVGTATANADNVFVGVTEDIASLATETTEGSTTYTNYILNKVSGQVGFYKAAGNKVAARKAYLRVANSAARSFFAIFDGETTSIRSIDNGQLIMDNGVYNLAGQRVAQPTKGLYIVNGKKVAIK